MPASPGLNSNRAFVVPSSAPARDATHLQVHCGCGRISAQSTPHVHHSRSPSCPSPLCWPITSRSTEHAVLAAVSAVVIGFIVYGIRAAVCDLRTWLAGRRDLAAT